MGVPHLLNAGGDASCSPQIGDAVYDAPYQPYESDEPSESDESDESDEPDDSDTSDETDESGELAKSEEPYGLGGETDDTARHVRLVCFA